MQSQNSVQPEKEVKKLPTIRPKGSLRQRERDKKIQWLRQLREKLQHFSLALRPQTIRMIWVKDIVKKEAQRTEVLAG
jgi:hypothetical protein